MNTLATRYPIDSEAMYAGPRREWTVLDLARVLRRHRRWLMWSVLTTLLLATLYWLLSTPRFEATGEVEVQRESAAAFGLEHSVNGDPAQADEDSLDYTMTLETEAHILESPTLALEVMRDLKLETTHDYFPQHARSFQLPTWLTFWHKPLEPLSIPLSDAPNRRYIALKIFASHLKVKPQPGTRLISVSYANPDPYLATEVVNRLMQALTEYSYQARYEATAQASSWLAGQLKDLRMQTRELEEHANRLQRDTGIYGDDASHNIVLDRLSALNQRVAAAEGNRILMEAVAQAASTGDPELLPALTGGGGSGLPGYGPQLAVIQSLREHEATLQSEIAEKDARYGPSHPEMAELRAELNGVQASIKDEAQRIGTRAKTDLTIAQASEAAARDTFEKQRAAADAASSRAVAYQLARQEADSSRGVYEGLLAKLKQAGVLEGLRSTNLTVVMPASAPPTHRPSSPNMPLVYAAALFGGLMFGCVGGVAAEFSDRTVRSLERLEQEAGSPLLGVLPEFSDKPKRMPWELRSVKFAQPKALAFAASAEEPCMENHSRFLESVRSLRTALLLLRGKRGSQVVLVTSSIAGEGKSKVVTNLANVLAQLGERVLLVDADLRRPSIYKELGIPGGPGLDQALEGKGYAKIHSLARTSRLSVLCGNKAASRPSELLASPRMQALLERWRQEYDFILLDSPPILPATDAVLLAQNSDVTLLVARHGYTPWRAVQRSLATLGDQRPPNCQLRVVLNGISRESYDYRDYYGYAHAPDSHRAKAHSAGGAA